MRYPALEKLEIILLVEQSHLPVRRTLEKIGIPRATFYRWYDLYYASGVKALEDRSFRRSLEPTAFSSGQFSRSGQAHLRAHDLGSGSPSDRVCPLA
jgi:transposase-like protein